MKKHTDYETEPATWEEFSYCGETVIAVPSELVGCRGCVARTSGGSASHICMSLPSCGGLTFLRHNDEAKVRIVKWRLGLSEGSDET